MAQSLIYLAGPIDGLTYTETEGWRQYVTEMFGDGPLVAVTPMRGKKHLDHGEPITIEAQMDDDSLHCSNQAITRRDHWDVQRCDAVLMNLRGAKKVSIGCMFEAAWCFVHRKPLILVIEQEILDNPHWGHPMLWEAAWYITDDLEEAVLLLQDMFSGG